MELLKKRTIKTDLSTIGGFYINGVFQSWGLEPKDRGLTNSMSVAQIVKIKVPGVTAVPAGRYKVIKFFSPDHGYNVLRVMDVPGFDYIEIHIGNFPKDTKGCLLLGSDYGKDTVLNSKETVEAVYEKVFAALAKGEEVYITYED